MKVLIISPKNKVGTGGGVQNYFNSLKNKFTIDTHFFYINTNTPILITPLKLFIQYITFSYTLISLKPELIHLNPSLKKNAIIRDGIFILLSKLFRKKILVFFHGWDEQFAHKISHRYLIFFKAIYGKSDAFCVLANKFKTQLIQWGFKNPIFQETTMIDDLLLENFDISAKKYNNSILFLARIEKDKGIFTAIDSMKNLNAKLIIAGAGNELESAKKYVLDNKLTNIDFVGWVTGEKKKEILNTCSILILPSLSEGMPLSIIEGMAFGMSIITRPVGGIKDFFQNKQMGYLTESNNPNDFAFLLTELLNNKENLKTIGIFNHKYAKTNFLASTVIKRLETIYINIAY